MQNRPSCRRRIELGRLDGICSEGNFGQNRAFRFQRVHVRFCHRALGDEWLLLAFCVMAAANVLIESYFTNLPLSVLDYILLGTLALCVLLLLFRKPIRKKTGLYTLPLLLCGGCFLVWIVLIVLRDGADCLQQPFFYWSLFLTALPLLMAASRRLSHIDPYAEFRKPKAALQDVPS